VALREVGDVGHELLADRVHQRRGGEWHPPMAFEEADHAQLVLQTGLVDVQIHTVDALDLQRDTLGQHLGDAAR
jgi:hypothetical protein